MFPPMFAQYGQNVYLSLHDVAHGLRTLLSVLCDLYITESMVAGVQQKNLKK